MHSTKKRTEMTLMHAFIQPMACISLIYGMYGMYGVDDVHGIHGYMAYTAALICLMGSGPTPASPIA